MPEDARAGRQGGAWREAAGRPQTPGCAAPGAQSASPWVRASGSRAQVRPPRSRPGPAPRRRRGARRGSEGGGAVPTAAGWGSCARLSPKARAGPRQLGRRASSLAGLGGAQRGVPGAGSGPKSSRASGRGGPRRSPVPRASAAATAAAAARPRGVSRAAGPAQVTPSSARPRPAPPAGRPPPRRRRRRRIPALGRR